MFRLGVRVATVLVCVLALSRGVLSAQSLADAAAAEAKRRTEVEAAKGQGSAATTPSKTYTNADLGQDAGSAGGSCAGPVPPAVGDGIRLLKDVDTAISSGNVEEFKRRLMDAQKRIEKMPVTKEYAGVQSLLELYQDVRRLVYASEDGKLSSADSTYFSRAYHGDREIGPMVYDMPQLTFVRGTPDFAKVDPIKQILIARGTSRLSKLSC
jgi:hypothetical protein